jgi:hypothetical protein
MIQPIDRFRLIKAKQGKRRLSWMIDHPINKIGESLIDSLKQQFKEDLELEVGGETMGEMIIQHGNANFYELYKQHICPPIHLKFTLDCTINQSIARHVRCDRLRLNATLQKLLKDLITGVCLLQKCLTYSQYWALPLTVKILLNFGSKVVLTGVSTPPTSGQSLWDTERLPEAWKRIDAMPVPLSQALQTIPGSMIQVFLNLSFKIVKPNLEIWRIVASVILRQGWIS